MQSRGLPYQAVFFCILVLYFFILALTGALIVIVVYYIHIRSSSNFYLAEERPTIPSWEGQCPHWMAEKVRYFGTEANFCQFVHESLSKRSTKFVIGTLLLFMVLIAI